MYSNFDNPARTHPRPEINGLIENHKLYAKTYLGRFRWFINPLRSFWRWSCYFQFYITDIIRHWEWSQFCPRMQWLSSRFWWLKFIIIWSVSTRREIAEVDRKWTNLIRINKSPKFQCHSVLFILLKPFFVWLQNINYFQSFLVPIRCFGFELTDLELIPNALRITNYVGFKSK